MIQSELQEAYAEARVGNFTPSTAITFGIVAAAHVFVTGHVYRMPLTTITSAAKVAPPGEQVAGRDVPERTFVVAPCPKETETKASRKQTAKNACFIMILLPVVS